MTQLLFLVGRRRWYSPKPDLTPQVCKNSADELVDVAIVGGGAAGLATAVFAARRFPGRSIVILDGAARLGAKILVSGGGRCNVTNRAVTAADFCGGDPRQVKRVLAGFSVERTIAFFEELGVVLHEEEGGKLFPNTNQARTVLAGLMREADRTGVSILTERRVTDLESREGGFQIVTGSSESKARRLVLATGGQSLPKTGSDGAGYRLAQRLGHGLADPAPALVPLLLEGEFHQALSGISQDAEVSVTVAGDKPIRRRGALLWTHFGVSGPVVLNVSRFWHRAAGEGKEVRMTASLLPGEDSAAVERWLVGAGETHPKALLRTTLSRRVPARLAEAVLGKLEVEGTTRMAHLDKETRRRVVHALLAWPLPVIGSRGFRHAEVTSGGVPLREVDPNTMASRVCPGLSIVGEVLDVDGRIGGFNFQWAWSSAWVAARGIELP